MAYDPQSLSVVMFGGGGRSAGLSNETWEFSGGNWSRLNESSAPSPRYEASLAYDAAAGYLVLFGGSNRVGNPTNDTWIFEQGTWTNLSLRVAPPGATSMAYDPSLGAVMVYGEGGIGGNITWLFRNESWENVTPIHSPSASSAAPLSYDPLSQTVIMFGGYGMGNQTWSFNGTAWVRLYPANAPSYRWSAVMAYDALDGLTLLVGGGDSQTWGFGAGKVAFDSVPGPGGSTKMAGSLHGNGTSAWFPFGFYSLRGVPNPGYSGRGLNVSGSLAPNNGTYLLFGNATVRADFRAFPTVTLETLLPACGLVFNGTSYPNGSAPYFAAPGTFGLSAPPCGSVFFASWSATGNATIANATNGSTRITLTGPATVVAHFLADLEFFYGPFGGGGMLVDGTRVPSGVAALYPVGEHGFQAVVAPGWRLGHLTTSGPGVAVGGGLLSVASSGWVRGNFTAHPTVTVGTNLPACGAVVFGGNAEPNGSQVGTDRGVFAATAPSCWDAAFEGWLTSGNVSVSAPMGPSATVNVTGNGTLEALLAGTARLTVGVAPLSGAGYIEWNGSRLENGTQATLELGQYPIQAVAADGWTFVGWQTTGGVAAQSSVAVLSANGTLVAEFSNGSVAPPGHGGGGPGPSLILELGGAMGVAVAILAVLLRRRGRRTPPGAPTGAGGADGTADRAERE